MTLNNPVPCDVQSKKDENTGVLLLVMHRLGMDVTWGWEKVEFARGTPYPRLRGGQARPYLLSLSLCFCSLVLCNFTGGRCMQFRRCSTKSLAPQQQQRPSACFVIAVQHISLPLSITNTHTHTHLTRISLDYHNKARCPLSTRSVSLSATSNSRRR